MLSADLNRLICGLSPAARNLIAVLVLAPTTSCWLGDSVLGPDARVVQLTIVPAFSTQGLGAPSAVESLGFIVRRLNGPIVVADTVAVDIESGRVEYSVDITYTPPAETFTIELVLLDSNGDVAEQYRLANRLPSHFFIDEEGVLRALRIGIITEDEMRQQLEELGLTTAAELLNAQ